MKKIVMIVLLAIISTSCMAKTKVYGELHTSYNKVFAVGAKSRDNFDLNNSFIGVKSSTEIKKDISFIYQFVWGIDTSGYEDSTSPDFDNRNQVIGLASPSGAVVVGRFDTPFKKVGEKADLFWHSQLGQNRNITNARNWDLRADKIIAIQSPIKNGFQGSIAYASDISDTSRITPNGKAISLNGFYKKGKVVYGAAYEHHDLKNVSAKTNALRFSATFKDGPLKMVGFYQQEDNDTSNTGEPDASVFGVGLAYRKGKGTFKAQVYHRDSDNSNNTDLIAIGYDYNLLRKLDIYAQAAQINNALSIGGEDFDGGTSNSSRLHGVSLGVRFRF